MIRKINITLAVAFVILFAVKGLKSLSSSDAGARTSDGGESAADGGASGRARWWSSSQSAAGAAS